MIIKLYITLIFICIFSATSIAKEKSFIKNITLFENKVSNKKPFFGKLTKLDKINLDFEEIEVLNDKRNKNMVCHYSQIWQLEKGFKLSQTIALIWYKELINIPLIFIKASLSKNISLIMQNDVRTTKITSKLYLKKFFENNTNNENFWIKASELPKHAKDNNLWKKGIDMPRHSIILQPSGYDKFLAFIIQHYFKDSLMPNLTKAIFSNKTFSKKNVSNSFNKLDGPYEVIIDFKKWNSRYDISGLFPCINKYSKWMNKKYKYQLKPIEHYLNDNKKYNYLNNNSKRKQQVTENPFAVPFLD